MITLLFSGHTPVGVLAPYRGQRENCSTQSPPRACKPILEMDAFHRMGASLIVLARTCAYGPRLPLIGCESGACLLRAAWLRPAHGVTPAWAIGLLAGEVGAHLASGYPCVPPLWQGAGRELTKSPPTAGWKRADRNEPKVELGKHRRLSALPSADHRVGRSRSERSASRVEDNLPNSAWAERSSMTLNSTQQFQVGPADASFFSCSRCIT